MRVLAAGRGAEDGPFSQGGDSGSLIVDEKQLAVALLFAGGDQGLGFHSLLLDIAGEGIVARGALVHHAVAAGVGG